MITCPTCHFENADRARFCNQCGTELDAPRPVEGERKLATVLFADVASSTALAESMDAEDWAAIMNGAFAFMNAAIARFGGTVGRLMGDAVLAFFGAPVAQEDHAERAVRAGLALVESAKEYGRALRERHGLDFQLRVGINSGTSVLAFVGDSVKGEYTSMGDSTNVAARLQSAAEPGTVLISAATQRLVRGLFELREREPLEVKGKRRPVRTYTVVSPRAVPGPTRGIQGLHAPMVGRDRELALLHDRLAGLRGGPGATVALLGEAGLGKSRLVAELRATASDGDIAWYEGRAISYGQGLAYHPWQQVGRQLIGVPENVSAAGARAALASFLDRTGVGTEHTALLETMLAIETADSRAALADMDGDRLVQQVADAVMACIRASILARGPARPHVIALDDLHWSDSASLELVAQVATLTVDEPLLLICILRPDRTAPTWPLLDRLGGSIGASYVQVLLEPLDEHRSRELLAHLLHIEDLPEPVRSLILRKSDGNPFFLEEVLRSLLDSGHVVRENGHWRATVEIADVTIPDTIAGVLGARIDRLPEPTKRVAQTAAVLGRIFPYRALLTACRSAPAPERIENVDPHLGTLTYEELVREKARLPEREYIFKHALTQETAYGLLLRPARRDLHLRAGRALEEAYPERIEEMSAVLAHHFQQGGDGRRSAEYALRAADRAARLYALKEAADHYDRAYVALDAIADPPAELLMDAILGWSVARYKLTLYEGVADRLFRAEAVARAVDDRPRLARILSWIALMYMVTGFPSRAGPYLVESHELASALGVDQLLVLPLFFATDALVDRDPARAVGQFDEVIELARQNRMPEVEGHALASSAIALARLGEFDRARERIDAALASAPSGGHRVKEADVHLLVASAFYDLGELERGLEHARIGAELARSENAFECACAGYYAVGMGHLERRELAQARSSFDLSLEIGDRAGFGEWAGFRNRILAGAAVTGLQQGSSDAVADLETALANARSDHDDYGVAMLAQTLATVHLDRGDTDRAVEELRPALDYYRQAGMKAYLARALDTAARIADTDGREEDARRARAEAAVLRAGLTPAPAGGAQGTAAGSRDTAVPAS
jgi:class 3 adenylate cyclase/tetratricopeptide (TPR) repeat protein